MADIPAAAQKQTIIIKKIKKGGHGHHGGAWKVAYADFVTAMMAFFLLMWILNSTTEEQKKGLAEYFSPSLSNTHSGSGGDGMFGGSSIGQTNVLSSPGSPLLPTEAPSAGADIELSEDASEEMLEGSSGGKDEGGEGGEEQQAVILENQTFDAVAGAIKAAIANVPELKALADHIKIENTDEGLRIQIFDQKNYSMFPSGSAKMYGKTKDLLNMVALIIKNLSNKISISGHTDAYPFKNPRDDYDNWDLSSERAHATRRSLTQSKIPADRIANVVGRGAMDPLIKDDPFDARNRRVSITLLREHPLQKAPSKK